MISPCGNSINRVSWHFENIKHRNREERENLMFRHYGYSLLLRKKYMTIRSFPRESGNPELHWIPGQARNDNDEYVFLPDPYERLKHSKHEKAGLPRGGLSIFQE